MRRAALLALLAGLALAALCVRLGFWQLSRLEQKRARNRALATALAGRPLELEDPGLSLVSLEGRRIRISGRYDSTRHVLLRGRSWEGQPGVEVLTPLLLEGRAAGAAVLVNRGWLPSPDGATAHPEAYGEPGRVTVTGVVERLPHRMRVPATVQLPSAAGLVLLSVRAPVAESLAGRFPYALRPIVVRQLPDASLPPLPRRRPPTPANETIHLSYAVQWFSFAAILVVGMAVMVARGRGRRPGAGADAGSGDRGRRRGPSPAADPGPPGLGGQDWGGPAA